MQIEVGFEISDCYMHGCGSNKNICHKGVIEHVGKDYFIVRDLILDEPIIVYKDSYWVFDDEQKVSINDRFIVENLQRIKKSFDSSKYPDDL